MASLGLGKPPHPQARGAAQKPPSKEDFLVSAWPARATARSKSSKIQRRNSAAGIERSLDGAPGARQSVGRGGSRNRKLQYDAVDNEILSVLGAPGLLPSPGSHETAASPADDGGADSVSELAKRLADLISDSPDPGELPEEAGRADGSARAAPSSSFPPPSPSPDSAGHAGAEPATLAAPAQAPAGDPLGKKVLGKAAVQWLAQGAALLAADVVSREAAGEEGLPGVHSCGDLIRIAQEYMRRRAMPRGMQHKCELGLMHLPTVWDHVQRELQKALQAHHGVAKAADSSSKSKPSQSQGPFPAQSGAPPGAGAPLAPIPAGPAVPSAEAAGAAPAKERMPTPWTESATWLLLKQLARSEEYKKATRSPKKPAGSAAPSGPRAKPWLSAEDREATQQRIQEFVDRAMGLLEQERATEVEAAGLATSRGASAGAPGPDPATLGSVAAGAGQGALHKGALKLLQLPQPTKLLLGQPQSSAVAATLVLGAAAEQELSEGEVEAELEQASAALKGVVAVSSRIGSEGQLLLTLAGAGWQPLPPTRLSPGDLVCITVDDPPSALEPVRWKGSRPVGGASPASAREAPSSSWMPPRLRALSSTRLLGRVYRLQAAPAPSGGAEDAGTGAVGARAGGAAALVVALEGRHQEADAARLFGLRLCVERLQPLVDATTFERNRAALETLRRHGLEEKCAAKHVVASLFRPLAPLDSPGESPGAPEEAGHAQHGGVLEGLGGPGRAPQGPQDEALESVEGALFSRDLDPTQPQPLGDCAQEAVERAHGGLGFDSSQLAAIQLALRDDLPVVAIQGPPGTGKTVVVTEIICRAVKAATSTFNSTVGGGTTPDAPSEGGAGNSAGVAHGFAPYGGAEGGAGAAVRTSKERSKGGGKVLACAPTNAAVDLLVERLVARGIRVVRVGSPERVSAAAVDQSLDSQLEQRLGKFRREVARRRADLRADMRACRGDNPMREGLLQMLRKLGRLEKDREREAVAHILSRAQVVLCTTTGAGEAVVRSMAPFSLAVLDEAGQATEPSSWIPLLLANRAVLSGDPCQLAPTVISPAASAGGLNVSLIERVFHEASLLSHSSRRPASPTPAAGWPQGRPTALPGSPFVLPSKGGGAAPATHGGSGGLAPAQEAGRAKEGVAGSGSSPRPGVACCMLETQYRMNASIAEWSSDKLYGGRLRAAAAVAGQLLADLPPISRSALSSAPWLLLDTRSRQGILQELCEEAPDPSASGSLLNEGEADIVVRHVAALLEAGLKPSEIAVQSPYQAQVQLIRARLQDLASTAAGASPAEALGTPGVVLGTRGAGPGGSTWQATPGVLQGAAEVEVATVDSFQGREAEAVIISMVRSNPLGTVGFLGDRRRLNVAVTRARRQVAVVCDSSTVSRNPFLRSLLLHIRKSGLVYSAADAAALYASES